MSLLLMIISNLLGFIFLKHKSDVCNAFSLFKSQVEIFFTSKIKILRTDGGATYKLIIKQFPQLIHQTTCLHTPKKNCLAERKT
jgi:hypothetical protein